MQFAFEFQQQIFHWLSQGHLSDLVTLLVAHDRLAKHVRIRSFFSAWTIRPNLY